MKIEFDKEADAMYIRLREGKFKNCIEISDSIIIDKDENGNVLGIELLNL